MSTIIDIQEKIIAKIDALIAATTIPAEFSTQDNDVVKGDLPLIIVEINNSDPMTTSGGGTALTDHILELIVVVNVPKPHTDFNTYRKVAINNFIIILDNLQIKCGNVKYQNGIYDEKYCVRARAFVTAFNDN